MQKLSGSDYEIVDGQPDIRGWDVKDDSGKKLGEVDELVFDEQGRKVRYIVVDLDDSEYDLPDRDVLVPIGIAELHRDDDDVILPGVTAEQLRTLPEYDEDRFDNEHEENTRNVFGGLGAAAIAGGKAEGDFYSHEHFNDDNLYRNRRNQTDVSANTDAEATIPVVQEELNIGKREVETGGIRLRSRVVEKEVSEDVSLREETVRVERNPVNRTATEADFEEAEVEEHERAEVPVVNKEARVVEEISLSKDVTEREETISDTVRKTEVDIDRDDDDRIRSGRKD